MDKKPDFDETGGIDPRTEAIALRYDSDRDGAPRVTAKGKGKIAERIIELAREAEIPIREEPDLLQIRDTCKTPLTRIKLIKSTPQKNFTLHLFAENN